MRHETMASSKKGEYFFAPKFFFFFIIPVSAEFCSLPKGKKISNFQREITILEEKLKEKDAELEKRKTELSHLRQSSK